MKEIPIPEAPEGVTEILDRDDRLWTWNGKEWSTRSVSNNTLLANKFALLLAYYGPLWVPPKQVMVPVDCFEYLRLLKVYSELRSQPDSTDQSIVRGMLDFITDGGWSGE